MRACLVDFPGPKNSANPSLHACTIYACIIFEVVGHRSFVNGATRVFRGLGAYVKDRVYGPHSKKKYQTMRQHDVEEPHSTRHSSKYVTGQRDFGPRSLSLWRHHTSPYIVTRWNIRLPRLGTTRAYVYVYVRRCGLGTCSLYRIKNARNPDANSETIRFCFLPPLMIIIIIVWRFCLLKTFIRRNAVRGCNYGLYINGFLRPLVGGGTQHAESLNTCVVSHPSTSDQQNGLTEASSPATR